MREAKIHSVKYNFVMNFILTSTQFIFPLITFPYVSRVLQAAGNGKVSFAASVANYFIMVASLGIPTYGIRACAKVRDNKEQLSKTVQELFLINLVMTVLVTFTYLLCIFCVPRFQEDRILFLINGINIVLNMFGMSWLFQALEQYDYITFRSIAFKLISIVLMFVLVHEPNDYVIYGAITVFAAVGSNILNFIIVRRLIDFRFTGDYDFKQHIKPILILFSQSLAVSIYTNLDTVMLGFMKTPVDVGYYNVAEKLRKLLLSLVSSLGGVLLPRMSYYLKNNKVNEYKSYALMALNFSLLMSVPLAVYFTFYSKEVILFLAGPGYEGAVSAMQLITIAVIPTGLTSVLGIQVLTSMEKEKYVLLSVVVGAIVDFLLNLAFIPQLGAAGASLATMIAEFSVLVVQVIYTKSLLWDLKKGFRIQWYILLTIISVTASRSVTLINIKSNFITLLCTSVVFFGVYGIGLILIREPLINSTLNGIFIKMKKKS